MTKHKGIKEYLIESLIKIPIMLLFFWGAYTNKLVYVILGLILFVTEKIYSIGVAKKFDSKTTEATNDNLGRVIIKNKISILKEVFEDVANLIMVSIMGKLLSICIPKQLGYAILGFILLLAVRTFLSILLDFILKIKRKTKEERAKDIRKYAKYLIIVSIVALISFGIKGITEGRQWVWIYWVYVILGSILLLAVKTFLSILLEFILKIKRKTKEKRAKDIRKYAQRLIIISIMVLIFFGIKGIIEGQWAWVYWVYAILGSILLAIIGGDVVDTVVNLITTIPIVALLFFGISEKQWEYAILGFILLIAVRVFLSIFFRKKQDDIDDDTDEIIADKEVVGKGGEVITNNATSWLATATSCASGVVLLSTVVPIQATISHVLPPYSTVIERDSMLVGFKGLVLKEVVVNESSPMLNYVFFDKERKEIPSRYKLFKSADETENFLEDDLSGSELRQYYHLLNIIGSRMKERPNTRITLVGCNDNLDEERENIELSKARATAVQEYLTSIWGIEKSRIKVTARNLPLVPSNQTIADGQAENRRVEIVEDVGTLLKPINIERKELLSNTPEKVDFNVNVVSDKPINKWTLSIIQDNKLLKQFTGDKSGLSTFSWNWLDDNEMLPQSDKPIVYSGVIYTTDDDSVVTKVSEIPVKKVVMTSEEEEGEQTGKIIEKINLILYQFNQYNLSSKNMEILKSIFPKITPDATVSVYGYTDIIGADEVDLSLSINRARLVYETLRKNRSAKSYKYEGFGKHSPIYNNQYPEGRFYNRTVQVTIEKDVKKV